MMLNTNFNELVQIRTQIIAKYYVLIVSYIIIVKYN
jgi:hypothetical protein